MGARRFFVGPLLAAALLALSAATAGGAPADEQYAIAARHYSSGDWTAAAKEFQQFLDRHPAHAQADDAHFFRCESLVQSGKFAEACELFADFLRRAPQHRLAKQALFRSGECSFLTGKNIAAGVALEQFQQRYPADQLNAFVLAYLGDLALDAKDAAKASMLFQRSLQDFPKSPAAIDCTFGMGRVHELQGKKAEALKLYETVAGQIEHELADDVHLRIAVLHYDAQDYTKAEQALAAFRATFAASELRSQAEYWLGMAQLQQKKNQEAAATLLSATTEFAKSDEAPALALAAAQALKQSGDAAGAQEQYRKVVEQFPQSQEALCSALIALQRYEEAAPLLREQIAATINDSIATKLRGQLVIALAETGKLDDADRELAAIPQTHRLDEGVLNATLHLAERAYALNSLPLAARQFQALTGGDVPAEYRARGLSGLAWTQARSNDNGASAETFEQLLQTYPDSPLAIEAMLTRAKSLAAARQFDAALATYRTLLDTHPNSPQTPAAMLAAARLHDELEQDREAAALLERLITEHPQFNELDAALYCWAWVLCDLKEVEKADALFARIHNEHSSSAYWADATYRLAERAARGKNPDRSMELATKLVDARCDAAILVHALYLRGQLAATAGKWTDVQTYMQQTADQFPEHSLRFSADYWLAEAAYRQADYVAAADRLEKLDSEAAGRNETWLPIIPLRRAQILAQQDEWGEALAIAKSIRERFPTSTQQHEADYLIGRCHASQARFDDARAAYTLVLESPQHAKSETAAMAQWMIGETYFHQRRHSEALAAYELCAAFPFPKWQAAALLQAGKCRQLQNDTKGAISQFEKIVGGYSDTPYAAEATTRLRELREQAAAAAKTSPQ